MKNKLLAFLLAFSLLLTTLPAALAEDLSAPVDEIEAVVPEIAGEDGSIALEDLTSGDDETVELQSEAVEMNDAAIALSTGYARITDPLNAVYDDDFVIIGENLPMDTVVYVERVESDGRAQIVYSGGDNGLVRGWMDVVTLKAMDEDAQAKLLREAEKNPEGFTYFDEAGELPLPLPAKAAAKEAPALNQSLAALAPGETLTLTVADGRPVSWSSDDETVAFVSADGIVTAVGIGSANITALDADGQTAVCKVRVALLAEASILPDAVRFNVNKLNIGLGEVSDALEVILGTEDDVDYIRALTFESSKPKYVTVDEEGVLVGIKKGSSTITVRTSNGLKATCKVTVKAAPTKITISPKTLKLNAGESKALTSKLTSSSSAGAIDWSSSDEDVAIVDKETGVVTAIAPGMAVITAETYNGKTAQAAVMVLDEPTSLTFEEDEIVLGVKQKVIMPAVLNPGAECDIRYVSSNPRVVSVKGDTFTAVAPGEATIIASTYNGLTAECVIRVEAAPKSVKLPFKTAYMGEGETLQLEPVVDGSAIGLTYTSSKKSIVDVTEDGLVTALKAGTSYITIKTYNKKSFKLKVIVQSAPTSLTVSPSELDMSVGETAELSYKVSTGSYASLTLSSSDPDVATIDDDTGVITAHSIGSAIITAETYNGLSDTCLVTVNPAPEAIQFLKDDIELGVKETAQLEVEMIGGRSMVTYSSANPKVATVSSTGLVTAKAAGTTIIRATTSVPSVYAEALVSVWEAPSSVKMPYSQVQIGVDEAFQIEPIIPENSRTSFIFSSSNESVATVDDEGIVTGISLGSATITVRTLNGKSATMKISVLDPYAPESIKMVGTIPTLEVGEEWQIVYSIVPSTAETDVMWSSSNEKVVTVDNDGWIYAVGKGTATITAVATKNSKCRLTVNVKVTSVGGGQELVTAIPKRITNIDGIDDNLAMIEDIHQSALYNIELMQDEGEISSSDASRRAGIIDNIFENYAFPWMTLRYQDYWKEKNSEGGVKDFKPGNVYYGLPYISGSGDNRHYNVALALSENRYYDSGEGYYIMNQNRLLSGKYVGNDCSGLVDVSIWGTNSKHSDDRTSDIAKDSAYRTISDWKAMRTGDLICKGSAHVVMFLYYVNDERTQFMMIENGGAEAGTNTVHCDIYNASYYINGKYSIRRLASLG